MESLTFALAMAGYCGLAATSVVAAGARVPRRLWTITAAIIVAHVALVWSWRYQWRLDVATRNGYAGFLLFHGALAVIVATFIVAERRRRVMIWSSFVIVTIGAIGAVFMYAEVTIYRVPVILVAAAGHSLLIVRWWQRRAAPQRHVAHRR